MKSLVFFSRTSCLLPFLAIFNLFFGWLFLKPGHWLIAEAVLVILFVLNGLILIRKMTSSLPQMRQGYGRKDAVDTEAEVIEEGEKGEAYEGKRNND
jgi:hypothetical protein